MIVDEDAHELDRQACDSQAHQAEVQRFFHRNYAAHVIEGGVLGIGWSFISLETILPALVHKLGGPTWMISLAPALLWIGISLPSLFVAHTIERLRWKKPITVVFAFPMRAAFLPAAVCLLLFSRSHPALTLWAVILAPFVNGLFCGLSFPAWMELVAKTIPGNKLSSMFAARLIVAGIGGFAGGAATAAILGHWSGTTGYGILYLIASGFFAVSLLVYLCVRETNLPPRHETLGLRESLLEMRSIVRTDRNFVCFLWARTLIAGAFIAMPFMSLRALEVLRCDEGMLGFFVMAMLAGALAGNILAGLWGDKRGAKTPLTAAVALYAVAFLLAAFATNRIAFLAAFFFLGFCRDSLGVLFATLNAELPPPALRVRYMSLTSALAAPSMLAAALIGTLAKTISGGFLLPAILAACTMLAAAGIIHRVNEPRPARSR